MEVSELGNVSEPGEATTEECVVADGGERTGQ